MMAEATSSSDEVQEEGSIALMFLIGEGPLTPERWAKLVLKVSERLKPKLPHLGLSELHVLLSQDGISKSLIGALPASTRRLRVVAIGKKNASPETNANRWPRVYLQQDGNWLLIQHVGKSLMAQPFSKQLMINAWSASVIPWEMSPRRILYSLSFMLEEEVMKAGFHRDGLLRDQFWLEALREEIDIVGTTVSATH